MQKEEIAQQIELLAKTAKLAALPCIANVIGRTALNYGRKECHTKEAIAEQAGKIGEYFNKLSKMDDPNEIKDLINDAFGIIAHIYNVGSNTPEIKHVFKIIMGLFALARHYRIVEIRAAQLERGQIPAELLKTEFKDVVKRYATTIENINECFKQCPGLLTKKDFKELEQANNLTEIEKLLGQLIK